jgi:hypothetical protein
MRFGILILSFLAVLPFAGCGSSTACSVDTDCPGVEVCIAGRCVDRPEDGGSDGGGDLHPDGGDGGGSGDGSSRPAALVFTFETGSNEASSANFLLVSDGFCFGEPAFPLTERRYALVDSFVW